MWSFALGVGSNRTDVPVDFALRPVLFEDFGAEGIVIAEDMFNAGEDSIGGKGKSTDATEEVDVCDFFMDHIIRVSIPTPPPLGPKCRDPDIRQDQTR